MTDPIADMLARIKNALLARHSYVMVPHSKVKAAIANLLVEHEYLEKSELVDEKLPQPNLKLSLKYVGKAPAITEVRRVSKPGRRVYSSAKQLPKTLGGYGITIVSSSQGLLTDQSARQKNIGGEVLCQIW